MLLSLGYGIAGAEEFNAKVIAVMDGDTVLLLRDTKKIKVRLSNIDAPEHGQAFAAESRRALSERVLQKQVRVNSRAVDSYGRMIAEISVGGRSVNEEQVRSGMAWEYSHFHRNPRYLALQSEAQQARRGLWAAAGSPMPPEQWRKLHPSAERAQANSKTAADKSAHGCGNKRLCVQMQSCEEAFFYLRQCGLKTLDGNSDGVPCDELCAEQRHRLH
jgi:endonuclease YncB( thermonuclease family)